MSAETRFALFVGVEDRCVSGRRLLCQPAEERRPEVEADAAVIVDDPLDRARFIEDPRPGIRPVALGAYPLVPIMKRRRAVLDFDRLQPRVLAGRLVKMPVYTNKAFQISVRSRNAAGPPRAAE